MAKWSRATQRYLCRDGEIFETMVRGIEERTDALTEVLEKYMRKAEKPVSRVTAPGSYLSDESVRRKAFASKQGEKFKALWDGVIPEGKSHSEADAALCAMLAFWCGGDIEQMDRLFRQSALMRDKWERDDYRTATLTKAVTMCSEFYKPVGRSSAADDFSDLQQTLCELAPAENDRYPWNDIGNGRLFADIFKDIARFVPERKQWHIYDGTRWVSDTGSLKAMELCKALANALMRYALDIHDEHKRKSYLCRAISRSYSGCFNRGHCRVLRCWRWNCSMRPKRRHGNRDRRKLHSR